MIGAAFSFVTVTVVSSLQRHVRIQHPLTDHRAEMKGHYVHKLVLQLSITQNSSHAQTPPSSLTRILDLPFFFGFLAFPVLVPF